MRDIDKKTKHILISQIKNVGDVVLALPAIGLIRARYPGAIIGFLATQYTQSVLAGCSDVDYVLNWDDLKSLPDNQIVQKLQQQQITTIIHFSRDDRIARLAKEAAIPYRIGTLQSFPHWIYCNRWVNQARRHSCLHEAQLNIHMLKPLNIGSRLRFTELISYMHFAPQEKLPASVEKWIDPKKFNLIIHPGSNGHGREWPTDYFEQLIEALPQENYQIFLTGSVQERERFNKLIEQSPKAIDLMGTMTLAELITFISRVDGLLASGTGPLHLAAALGIKTLGLFPPRQGISQRRWAPLGKQASAVVYARPFYKTCFSCRDSLNCFCMKQIHVKQVLDVIKQWRID